MSLVKITNETVTLYLLCKHGRLFLPKFGEDMEDDAILMVVYPEGDCDTFPWPELSRKDDSGIDPLAEGKIARALFDAREMGHIPSKCRYVVFPGQSEPWAFDEHVGGYKMPSMEGIWY